MSFWSDLGSSFTGSGAKKELNKGIAAVNQGRDQAVGAFQQYGEQARGELDRYRDEGGKAFTLHNDSAGVNGADARGAAQGLYLSDDILAKTRADAIKRSGQMANAGGGYNSGAAALAASRVNQQAYGDWQNRLAGIGQQGQQAATTMSGIDQNTGAGVAGSYQTGGQQAAGLYGQKALAANTLGQNLIGLGSLAVSAYTGMPTKSPNSGVNKLA